MEEEDSIIVKWAQEDIETSYNLLNKFIIIIIIIIIIIMLRNIGCIRGRF